MNYTFLPQIERLKLKREYRTRALVVGLFILSTAMIIGTISLFPTYIDSKLQENSELAKIAEITKTNDANGLEEIKRELAFDNALLSFAEKTVSGNYYYEIISNIILAKGSIKIGSISVTDFSTTTISFTIQGNAPTREGLTSYKNRLESTMPGSMAEVPLSDLAKSKDIPFSIKFTYSI
jgi:diacylglycerol kinase family enzyme